MQGRKRSTRELPRKQRNPRRIRPPAPFSASIVLFDPKASGLSMTQINSTMLDLSDELVCRICLARLEDTVLIPSCFHYFCRKCIEQSIRMKNNKCPLCRSHIVSKRYLRNYPLMDTMAKLLVASDEEEDLPLHKSTKRQAVHGNEKTNSARVFTIGESAEEGANSLHEELKGAATGSKNNLHHVGSGLQDERCRIRLGDQISINNEDTKPGHHFHPQHESAYVALLPASSTLPSLMPNSIELPLSKQIRGILEHLRNKLEIDVVLGLPLSQAIQNVKSQSMRLLGGPVRLRGTEFFKVNEDRRLADLRQAPEFLNQEGNIRLFYQSRS